MTGTTSTVEQIIMSGQTGMLRDMAEFLALLAFGALVYAIA